MEIKRNGEKRIEVKWIALFGIVLVVSFVRFFYGITGDNFSFLDEYTTFDTAAGFFYTGKFFHWDFHYNILSDYEYTRAWPHTILLAGWFKIFGLNVVSGKILSVVFGMLFMVSMLYITKKIYNSYYVTALSCLIVLTNEIVIETFRQIRMYSLWLLIMIWLAYFAYQLLTITPQKEYKGKIGKLYQQYFNFSPVYIFAVLLLLILGYSTHVNTLALGVGVIAFFVYCLVTRKEKRYYTALALLAGIVLLLVFVILCVMPLLPDMSLMHWWTVVKTQAAGRMDINTRYWRFVSTFLGSKVIFYGMLFCVLYSLTKYKKKSSKEYSFSIYALCVVSSALVFFILVLSRYFAERYILYIAPLLAILLAWGTAEGIRNISTQGIRLLVMLISVIWPFVYMGLSTEEIYYNDDIVYHRAAYQILKEDAKKEQLDHPIPIVEFDFRDYYGVQVLDDYVTSELMRTEEDVEILKNFAESYPDGYMLIETDKVYGFSEPIKNFVLNHSEQIGGGGIDDNNLEMVRYHVRKPKDNLEPIQADNIRINGPVTYYFTEDGKRTRVRLDVDMSMVDTEADMLFLTFGIFTVDKETEDRCYQLLLPESGIGSYEILFDQPCIEFLLKDECMIYFNDKTCREKMLYEQ